MAARKKTTRKKTARKSSGRKSGARKSTRKSTRKSARKSTSKRASKRTSKKSTRKTTRKKSTRKYGPSASKRVESAMHRKKKGTLRSGSGRKVTSRKQAIAIGLSEAREKGAKVPKQRSSRKSSSS
jgi:hypothetical protein